MRSLIIALSTRKLLLEEARRLKPKAPVIQAEEKIQSSTAPASTHAKKRHRQQRRWRHYSRKLIDLITRSTLADKLLSMSPRKPPCDAIEDPLASIRLQADNKLQQENRTSRAVHYFKFWKHMHTHQDGANAKRKTSKKRKRSIHWKK